MWTDLHDEYSKILDVEVNADNIRSVIEEDPVPFSRYWKKRVDAIRERVILAQDGPLGNVEHYYMRTEYQHRGLQHVHCLFWIKEKPGTDADAEEIRTFHDKYLTCRIPCDDEPRLKELVESCQTHFPNHPGTCKRAMKFRGRIFLVCRFNFPRNP